MTASAAQRAPPDIVIILVGTPPEILPTFECTLKMLKGNAQILTFSVDGTPVTVAVSQRALLAVVAMPPETPPELPATLTRLLRFAARLGMFAAMLPEYSGTADAELLLTTSTRKGPDGAVSDDSATDGCCLDGVLPRIVAPPLGVPLGLYTSDDDTVRLLSEVRVKLVLFRPRLLSVLPRPMLLDADVRPMLRLPWSRPAPIPPLFPPPLLLPVSVAEWLTEWEPLE